MDLTLPLLLSIPIVWALGIIISLPIIAWCLIKTDKNIGFWQWLICIIFFPIVWPAFVGVIVWEFIDKEIDRCNP